MAWGTLQVGRVFLREGYEVQESADASGALQLTVTGAELYPTAGMTVADIQARQRDLQSLLGEAVPVVFQFKTSFNGYYRVVAAEADMLHWEGEAAATRWALGLAWLGADNATDLESRLSNLVRLNDFAQAGTRWHAPPIGATGYTVGNGVSPGGSVTRTGENGAHLVWLGIPSGSNPRYGVAVGSWRSGRVRFLSAGIERAATRFKHAATGWTLDNGLVRISPLTANGVLRIESHDGTQWEAKDWHLARGTATTSLGVIDQISVLVNRPEVVVLRLYKVSGSSGRTYADLTLRRGSRFVEVAMQTDIATTLGAYLHTNETTTNNAASGYVVATSNDAAGNKMAAGSPNTFTGNTNGGLSKAATTTFNFWLGSVVGGTGAAVGDSATDLRDQYIGTQAETIGVVPR